MGLESQGLVANRVLLSPRLFISRDKGGLMTVVVEPRAIKEGFFLHDLPCNFLCSHLWPEVSTSISANKSYTPFQHLH